MSAERLNLLEFSKPNIRTLHFAWFAFFTTFVVWFNHAPLLIFIKETFNLTTEQIKALLILNVALTIPSRIIIGILVDKFGPRKIYSGLLIASSFVCWGFAFAQTYEQLAMMRFLLGFTGAGFVIGIRLVGEWFPAKQVGIAEGIYGGWGNFGAAASAATMPALAALYGGDDGWRYAIATTGVLAFVYGWVFYFKVQNTPKGSTYFKPKKAGGLEVTSKADFYFLLLMNIPMYIALAVLTWKLCPGKLNLLSDAMANIIYFGLLVLFIFQTYSIYNVNKENLKNGVPEMMRYKFKQVACLDWAYFVTFGSELAVVSMLPLFFVETYHVSALSAGFLASGFAFMNLVARPGGGYISDRFGRRKSLMVLIAGLAVGFILLSQITSSWPIWLAVVATMACSFFVQSGCGAVFAMVPLVQRRMTGQIAGMAGAYGNVGGVAFLTVLSSVSTSQFFMVIAACAALCFILICFMMDEPSGQMAEILPDGTVQLIDVH